MTTSTEVNDALKNFLEVKRSLDVQKSLPWNLAVDTLKKCIPLAKTSQETQAFLDDYFLKMIDLLLKQTNKIESFERECIEKSCEIAIDIILSLLPDSCQYLKVLEKIFDSSCLYYCGFKGNWAGAQGFPAARINTIKRFADNNGFSLLLEYLTKSGCWPGADTMHLILLAVYEACVDLKHLDAIMDSYIKYSMQTILSLNDEQVKEVTKAMKLLVKGICKISQTQGKSSISQSLKTHQIFLLDHAVRMVNSSSFVVKLYGWELINDIIKEAVQTRPSADGYLLQGAGNEIANGMYKVVGVHNDAHKYQKEPSRPGEPLLTIFRCNLEDKKKLWYISEADRQKPGTNNDIDYYQHKPSVDDQKEPPLRGWIISNSKHGQFGRDPAPILTRIGSHIPDGMIEDMYLCYRIPFWVRDSGLLGKLFGESAHVEIVNRSLKLMSFLNESGSLTDEDIRLIWKAATQSHDATLVDEFFFILVSLSQTLEERLFSVLISCAKETLQQDEQVGLAKVSQFVEKFSMEGMVFNLHSKESSAKLLELLWTVYKNPGFEALKNGSIIQELLSKCLKQKGGSQALSSVKESTSVLEGYITGAKVSEVAASRVIQTLQFLINSAHVGQDGVKQLDGESFSSVLMDEIRRFVSVNRSKSNSSKATTKWFISQIYNRLQVIRQFYGICSDVKITNNILDSLCLEFRENPQEMEEFFGFLKRGASVEGELELMCTSNVMEYIFSNIICSDSINWSNSGNESFECFRTYFTSVNHNVHQQEDPLASLIGFDTLWRIYLFVPTETAQQGSIDLLLLTYEELIKVKPDAYEIMINKIFEYLRGAENSILKKCLSERESVTISRCIELLLAIVRWKGSLAPSHATKGCMSRETIVVKHRKVYPAYDSVARANVIKIDKASEGIAYVDVHPMHTIGDIKKKIIANNLANVASSEKAGIEKNGKKIDENVRLFQIRPYDTGELRLSYTMQWSRNDDLYGESDDRLSGFNLDSIEMIKNEIDFQCLLNLAEHIDDSNISSKIWDLLMMLPSQSAMYTQIEKQLLIGNFVSWSQIISTNSLASATYKLQIIDSILFPAPEFRTEEFISRAVNGRKAFVASDGVSCVFNFFTSNFDGPKSITRSMYASCLHLIHFLLFGSDNQDIDAERSEVEDLIFLMQEKSGIIVEKLLAIASDAAAMEQSDIVHNALHTLTYLLKSPDIISQLISNPQSKTLLVTVLKSGLKRVREMACDFAIKVGKAQPIVFKWLLAELETIEFNDELCADMFRALNELLDELSSIPGAIDHSDLALLISLRLMEYPSMKIAAIGERQVLFGYLELLAKLIHLNYRAVEATEIGSQLVHVIISDFLFSIDKPPICDTLETKQAAFKVLLALVTVSPSCFRSVLTQIYSLSKNAAFHIKDNWGLQVLNDMRRIDISHSGLKNQGCTCYMNSLLQQLFMNVPFREAILKTPLFECHRTTSWHRSDEEFVNVDLLFEFQDGSMKKGQILRYDSSTNLHEVYYAQPEEKVMFNIREGRYQKETGRFRIIPSEFIDPLKEHEDHAYKVLEQLQRTFVFMKHSKRRYFDPRPFVEACKTLNMNFNVYQQNDAAEFYDQLLDRIEIATKGIHTKVDVWQKVILKRSFGAETLYQKIPQDCDIYSSKKEECGHWQGSRIEPFLKLEFQIRGKEKIYDSLDDLVQSELMDGENKIECDVCVQKKTTNRRSCISKLPNLMVLHLKRFDLDYQTFETVKLNNRMEFPFETRLNMFNYTKEGLEWEELNKQKLNEEAGGQISPKPSNIQYENNGLAEPDMTDYEFELQGVLVHSGVAQGGHYYSFSRDPENEEKWYKFDDEDVTSFNLDQIPTQCFGGPAHSNYTGVEEDRTSNALILFYKKTRVNESTSIYESDIKSVNDSIDDLLICKEDKNILGLKLVDGNEAFLREVNASNLQHALSCYLLDCEMHVFVRALISSLCKSTGDNSENNISLEWSISNYSELPHETIRFGVHFLLDVILHCRERAGMQLWINALRDAFQAYPETAHWFVKSIVMNNNSSESGNWFSEYLSQCTDANARYTFVQVLFHAVVAIAPVAADALEPYNKITIEQIDTENRSMLLSFLVRLIVDKVFTVQYSVRLADELFVLIRELAGIPCMNHAMIINFAICKIAYFAIPEQSPKAVKEAFAKQNRSVKFDNFYLLLPCVMEALAAILGVPQIRKVPLIVEGTHWDNVELVPEAKEAFTIIFNECTDNGRLGGMDIQDIVNYKEKTNGPKITIQQARIILDKFQSQDARLGLVGFLNYYADLASINQREVWRDLQAFEFKNDLTRSSTNMADPSALLVPDMKKSSHCREVLSTIALYEVGLQQAEAATKAILTRVCYNEKEDSNNLLIQALAQLLQQSKIEYTYYEQTSIFNIIDIVKHMILIDDDIALDRIITILFNDKIGLLYVYCAEQRSPSQCRANEYDLYAVSKKYIEYLRQFCTIPRFYEFIELRAETDEFVRDLKRSTRLRPGAEFSENEEALIKETIVVVSGAGVPEVNGEYHFREFGAYGAGSYYRVGTYMGKPAYFTIYKWKMKNRDFHWFISKTPEGKNPGTAEDIDFYSVLFDDRLREPYLPPKKWDLRNNDQHSKPPTPTVLMKYPLNHRVDDYTSDSSDSDELERSNTSSEIQAGASYHDYPTGGGGYAQYYTQGY